jgi:hypothetical protein
LLKLIGAAAAAVLLNMLENWERSGVKYCMLFTYS